MEAVGVASFSGGKLRAPTFVLTGGVARCTPAWMDGAGEVAVEAAVEGTAEGVVEGAAEADGGEEGFKAVK